MAERRFMPVPAELRELAGELRDDDRAIVAWDAVKKALSMHAYYYSVDFDDRAINAAVWHLGGWERLDELFEEQEEHWIRQEFVRAYAAYHRRGVSRSEGAPLGGYFARVNASSHPEAVPQARRIVTTLTPTRLLDGPQQKAIAAPAAAELAAEIGRMP
jgi:hypothetical protein